MPDLENKLAIGAKVNLTCTALQTNGLAKNARTKPHRTERFDPQINESEINATLDRHLISNKRETTGK